jgi:hypothetical protein
VHSNTALTVIRFLFKYKYYCQNIYCIHLISLQIICSYPQNFSIVLMDFLLYSMKIFRAVWVNEKPSENRSPEIFPDTFLKTVTTLNTTLLKINEPICYTACSHLLMLANFSALKTEIIWSSETSTHRKSTQCHIPEDDILHSHCCENLKSYIATVVFPLFCPTPVISHSRFKAARGRADIFLTKQHIQLYLGRRFP